MILLSTTDFKGGKYDIPDSDGIYTGTYLQQAIDRYEKIYIYKLLGVALGDLIITWLAASRSPANANYVKVVDGFSMDDADCGGVIVSSGMKEYLKAAIFYEYVKNSLLTSQPAVIQPMAEKSTTQGPGSTMRFAENKFNGVMNTIEAIQYYCELNSSAFPTFNGQEIKVKASNIF